MTTTLAPTHFIPRRKRFVRETPVPFQLTERDVEIVRLVADHRFPRSTHISELIEAPHKKVCDRLTSLYHAGYLDRPRNQLEYYRAGGGSSAMVYALGNRGAHLLIERDELEGAVVDWARKNVCAMRAFIMHTLAIADVRVALKRAVRTRPGFKSWNPSSFSNWRRRRRGGGSAHGRGAQNFTTTMQRSNSG